MSVLLSTKGNNMVMQIDREDDLDFYTARKFLEEIRQELGDFLTGIFLMAPIDWEVLKRIQTDQYKILKAAYEKKKGIQ